MADIQTIKQAVASLMAIVQANLGRLSPAVKAKLAEVLELAKNRISELKSQVPEAEINESTKLLWMLSNGKPDVFMQYLQTFPDPALAPLLQDQDLLQKTLERLAREFPAPAENPNELIPNSAIQSSNVKGFRYNPQNASLVVKFQNGSVYNYSGVPNYVFNLMRSGSASAKTSGRNKYGAWWRGKNPSIGAALNQFIKQLGYPYQRIR